MRIALLTDGMWPFVMGGMQMHSYLLCKYLTRQSVFVTVFHPATSEEQELEKIFTVREREFLEWVSIPKVRNYHFPGHYLFESYLFSKNIYKELVNREDIDLVYAKGLTAWHFLVKKKNLSWPVAINIHGYEFMQRKANMKEWWTGRMLGLPFQYINQKADYVLSYGGKISRYIRQLKVSPERILELPGAVEKSWLCPEQSQKEFGPVRRFIFVGRFERRKGILELNQVISDLSDLLNFEFHFVGPIPDSIQLKNKSIFYHGEIRSRNRLIALLDKCDVLVCPSYGEGMPNVVLEAMARGCPVIATDVGAVNLIVNASTGWLIVPGSYTSLRKAMELAIEADSCLLTRKSNAALQLIRDNYTWDIIGKKTAQVLKQCVLKSGSVTPEVVMH